MVIVLKSNGKMSNYIDFTDLNKVICREYCPLKTFVNMYSRYLKFSKSDAMSEFWQIGLKKINTLRVQHFI